jgi:uncharacterized protein YjdB
MTLSRGTALWIRWFRTLTAVQAAVKRAPWSSARGGVVVLLTFLVVAACESGAFVVDIGMAPASITLDVVDMDLISGSTAVIQAQVQDAKGKPINVDAGGVRIEWSSSEDWIASVSPIGQVTARVKGGAAGIAEITATVHQTVATAGFPLLALMQGSSNRGGISASSSVNVRPADLLAVAGEGQSGAVGSTLSGELIVRAVDESGNGVPNVDIQFAAHQHHGTLDPATAVTDEQGRARTRWTLGETAGPMKAEASARNRLKLNPVEFTATATAEDDAEDVPVQTAASVTLSPTAATLAQGDTRQFSATVKDADGATISDASVAWSSSNTGVATVSSSGLVTVREAGTATITGKSGSASGTASVTVEAPATPPPPSGGLLPAFPGAEGWGATALNECRSLPLVVHKVTNTNDSGSGSLRDVLENRVRSDRFDVVIFTTGGLIRLQSDLYRRGAHCLYIAGQTAPGGGISLVGRRLELRNSNDVVVRHIRHRGANSNAIVHRGGQRMIYDHITSSWTVGRYLLRLDGGETYPLEAGTVQNSLLYEPDVSHSTVLGLTGAPRGNPEARRMTAHRNVLLGPGHRMPMCSAYETSVVNNVVYNWQNFASGAGPTAECDFVANYHKPGPATPSALRNRLPFVFFDGHSDMQGDAFKSFSYSLLIAENRNEYNAFTPTSGSHPWTDPHREAGCRDGDPTAWCETRGDPVPDQFWRFTRLPTSPIPVYVRSISDAYVDEIMSTAGHSRRLTCDGSWTPVRDEVDAERIRWFYESRGFSDRIQSADMVVPVPPSGQPCTDSDGDGLPDAWENRFFECSTCADPTAVSRTGYLVMEHYVNGTEPR